jgi:hypothetical protein
MKTDQKNSLYNKKHLQEYLLYGALAALCYIIPALVFFADLDYNRIWILFLGSILFMFAIMLYALKLSKRRPEYKSSWMMVIASHFVIVTGVIFSVLITVLLCFIFIPRFLSGHSADVLSDAPASLNDRNTNLIMILFLCATLANYFTGSFVAVLGHYVFKKDQTEDKSAVLENKVEFSKRPV